MNIVVISKKLLIPFPLSLQFHVNQKDNKLTAVLTGITPGFTKLRQFQVEFGNSMKVLRWDSK